MKTAEQSDSALKDRLRGARRSGGGKIPAVYVEKVRQMLKDGESKKIICTIFGVSYQELKEQIK